MFTLSGEATSPKLPLLLSENGPSLKGKDLLPSEKGSTLAGKKGLGLVCRKANMKSHKLSSL